MQYISNKKHPEGYILLFTLIILILMSLMGSVLLFNTTAEVRVSSNLSQGRLAFTRAESAAQTALFLARAALSPGAGTLDSWLNKDKDDWPAWPSGSAPKVLDLPYVKVSDDFPTTVDGNSGELTHDEIMEHYLTILQNVDPHLVLYQKNADGTEVVVGAASVVFTGAGITTGGSIIGGSGGGGAGQIGTYIVVRATGKVPRGTVDGVDYDDDESAEDAQSIVSTIYLNVN